MVYASNFIPESDLSVEVTADDTCVAARIYCLDKTFADPQITFATTSLTFYTNYGTGAVTDSTIGTAGVLTIADDDTFAELAALVNASTYWRMVLVAALPDDTVRASEVNNVIDVVADSADAKACASEVGSPLEFDTSVVKHCSVCLGAESLGSEYDFLGRRSDADARGPLDITDWELAGGRHARLRDYAAGIVSIYTANAEITAGTLKVYSVHQNDQDSTDYHLVRSLTGGTTGSSATDSPDYLHSRMGERLVVRYAGSAITTPTMRVIGHLGRLEQ